MVSLAGEGECLVDEATQAEVFAGAGFLVKGTGGRLSQAGWRWKFSHRPELMHLPVHVAVDRKAFQKGLALP